ncbi:MAG: erythromycin esterase family protein [Bacteroidota bacterium]|nr:erythromycin esterase family protein [Bacteroidota bacterium]MDP4192876.1 erythromycin esterase family protein [Bacteroidota bacterium]
MADRDEKIINFVKDKIISFNKAQDIIKPLFNRIGNAKLVLLGEATHGTHEFYQMRFELTKRLITEKGFNIIAVEADFPDAYRINKFIQGRDDGTTELEALSDFKRFPAWMWRNTVILEMIAWLKSYNKKFNSFKEKVGFFGLDLYSLNRSIDAVVDYLDKVDPEAAQRARYRYTCFDHFGEDPESYGYAAGFNLTSTCENEVIDQLTELRKKADQYMHRDGFIAEDEYFYAEQNALITANAEEYYRSMFKGHVFTWNLRARHMVQSLSALISHYEKQGISPKVILWEHNSHIGDARATDMSEHGEQNVGQIIRQKYGSDAALVGFTTYSGTVTAASDWGEEAERKRVREALTKSYEELFHKLEIPQFLITFDPSDNEFAYLKKSRLERAIGVIYRPETERISHYFNARISEQFDAVIHIDETRALEPLEKSVKWNVGEIPETFPSGV